MGFDSHCPGAPPQHQVFLWQRGGRLVIPAEPHSWEDNCCQSPLREQPPSAAAEPRESPQLRLWHTGAACGEPRPPSPSFSLVFPKPVMKQDLPVWNRWPYVGRQAGRT